MNYHVHTILAVPVHASVEIQREYCADLVH